MIDQANHNSKIRAPQDGMLLSSDRVQPIFVGTLVFIVLSVLVEYTLGDFIGLNIGEDFGLVIGGTIVFGICAGLAAGAVHDWISRAKLRDKG